MMVQSLDESSVLFMLRSCLTKFVIMLSVLYQNIHRVDLVCITLFYIIIKFLVQIILIQLNVR